MPVKSNFFNHFIMASSFVGTVYNVQINYKIDYHTAEYMEAMKSGNKEKEIAKYR